MKSKRLSVELAIKKKFTSAFGFKPGRTVSLYDSERPRFPGAAILENVSLGTSLEIMDPRSNRLEGHYFRKRDLFELNNVVLEPFQNLAYSPDGELIEETTPWPDYRLYADFPFNGKINNPKINEGICLSSIGYYHWLIEELPLTILALEKLADIPLIVSKKHPRYVCEFLNLIDREVIYCEGPVRCGKLFVIGKGKDSGWPHPSDLSTLRNFVPFKNVISRQNLKSRVYASRINSRRSPINEKSVEELFQENGFDVVRLEEFSILDEINLISNTSILAGVHGAGLANTIWQDKHSTLVDLVNADFWPPTTHRLAHLRDSFYVPVTSHKVENSGVDLEKVEILLKSLS
jgi:hypothetical protein